MDFFASQETARRNTKVLIGYFALAVVGLVVSLYFVVLVAANFTQDQPRKSNRYAVERYESEWQWWDGTLFLWSSLGTLTIILLGSGYKTMQLAGGGGVVARDLGGRLVDRNTTDSDERRLLNVIEEMSIAAGMPVPDVYVLEGEDGINAFAAGHTPGDAVIGVTRGCMRALNRDELQGVMAHEFSHILNGDMRLNLRLIGVLHGILIIAIIGQLALRLAMHSGGSRDKEGNQWRIAIAVGGGAIMALGYLGVFFGRLIQAAASRQREYLADASAVQFTRNPEGIASALKKIGGIEGQSSLTSPMAEEASHMMFGAAKLNSLFATHPPLQDRIKRIAPHWDGTFAKVQLPDISNRAARRTAATTDQPGLAAALASGLAMESTDSAAHLGEMDSLDLDRAVSIRASMPEEWQAILGNPATAQAMMFALLLSEDAALLQTELATLQLCVDEETLALTLDLHRQISPHSSSTLIAVIDLAIPALRRLSSGEYARFASILQRVMASDHRIDLFEFMVQKILRRHLDLHFRRTSPPHEKYTSLAPLLPEAHVILSLLAQTAGQSEAEIATAYSAAAAHLPGLSSTPLNADWTALDAALDKFNLASPLVKQQLLQACGYAVMADATVLNEEAELLRAVADTIGCPVPPFVVGLPIAA